MQARIKTLLAALSLTALSMPFTPPALAGGGDPDSYLSYPLGAMGGSAVHLLGEDYLRIKAVDKGGPLDKAGLLPGDEIIGVRVGAKDERFKPDDKNYMTGGTGPLRTLGEALDQAQARPDGRIDLMVRTGRREGFVNVTVAPIGSFSKDFPAGCPKSMRLFHASCDWLIAHLGDGGANIQPAWMGLALMCSSDPRHQAHVHKVAARIEGDLKAHRYGGNASLAWPAIFLAEYSHRYAKADPAGFARRRQILQEVCDEFVKRQGRPDNKGHECAPGYEGCFFHGAGDRCYGGTGQNIHTSAVVYCWAICSKAAGVKLNQHAWDLTYDYMTRRCTDANAQGEMACGYSGGGGLGDGQSNGRTAQTALGLLCWGTSDSIPRGLGMGKFLINHSAQSREAHAITSLGIIPSSAVIWRVGGPKAYRDHMDEWKWYLELMMQADGHAKFVPGKANNGGDAYLGEETVANCIAALMIAAPTRKLIMFGAMDPKAGYPGNPYTTPSDTPEYKLGETGVDPLSIPGIEKMTATLFGCRTQIQDGRVSEALQRLDELRTKKITEAEMAAVEKLTAYAYDQCLDPQLKAVEEALSGGDPLTAYRSFNRIKPDYPYAPKFKDRMATLDATFAAPKTGTLMDTGRAFEQILLQYQAKPEEYRARMEAFVKANPDSLYGRNGQQALDTQAQNGATAQAAVEQKLPEPPIVELD